MELYRGYSLRCDGHYLSRPLHMNINIDAHGLETSFHFFWCTLNAGAGSFYLWITWFLSACIWFLQAGWLAPFLAWDSSHTQAYTAVFQTNTVAK